MKINRINRNISNNNNSYSNGNYSIQKKPGRVTQQMINNSVSIKKHNKKEDHLNINNTNNNKNNKKGLICS